MSGSRSSLALIPGQGEGGAYEGGRPAYFPLPNRQFINGRDPREDLRAVADRRELCGVNHPARYAPPVALPRRPAARSVTASLRRHGGESRGRAARRGGAGSGPFRHGEGCSVQAPAPRRPRPARPAEAADPGGQGPAGAGRVPAGCHAG